LFVLAIQPGTQHSMLRSRLDMGRRLSFICDFLSCRYFD
jgi:hypothetical protein